MLHSICILFFHNDAQALGAWSARKMVYGKTPSAVALPFRYHPVHATSMQDGRMVRWCAIPTNIMHSAIRRFVFGPGCVVVSTKRHPAMPGVSASPHTVCQPALYRWRLLRVHDWRFVIDIVPGCQCMTFYYKQQGLIWILQPCSASMLIICTILLLHSVLDVCVTWCHAMPYDEHLTAQVSHNDSIGTLSSTTSLWHGAAILPCNINGASCITQTYNRKWLRMH